MTKTVFLTPDGRDVIIEGPIHSDRFPVEELRSRHAFYCDLRDRRCDRTKVAGEFAEYYAETVSALEKLIDEVGQ